MLTVLDTLKTRCRTTDIRFREHPSLRGEKSSTSSICDVTKTLEANSGPIKFIR